MKRTSLFLILGMVALQVTVSGVCAADSPSPGRTGWKSYVNARFGFSVEYPENWRLGDPLPGGTGVALYPPQTNTQVALSGFLNVVEGTSQDGRQTLAEFAAAHRRIMTELYAKNKITVKWEPEHDVTLGGRPARQLTFSYEDETKTKLVEIHIFSVGRNEGRGVRIKFPVQSRTSFMPVVAEILRTYQPGRDQDAVSPAGPSSQRFQ